MARDLDLLLLMLLDPCLTTDEALREATAVAFRGRPVEFPAPRRPLALAGTRRKGPADDPAWVTGHGSCI